MVGTMTLTVLKHNCSYSIPVFALCTKKQADIFRSVVKHRFYSNQDLIPQICKQRCPKPAIASSWRARASCGIAQESNVIQCRPKADWLATYVLWFQESHVGVPNLEVVGVSLSHPLGWNQTPPRALWPLERWIHRATTILRLRKDAFSTSLGQLSTPRTDVPTSLWNRSKLAVGCFEQKFRPDHVLLATPFPVLKIESTAWNGRFGGMKREVMHTVRLSCSGSWDARAQTPYTHLSWPNTMPNKWTACGIVQGISDGMCRCLWDDRIHKIVFTFSHPKICPLF